MPPKTSDVSRDNIAQELYLLFGFEDDEGYFGTCLDVADALLARWDIRPHSEPAGAPVPDGMTAEKLRDLADLLEDLGLTLGLVPEKAEWLREWADVLAARDVGGDSPAEARHE